MKYHVTDPSMEFLGCEGVKYCFLSINQKAAEKKNILTLEQWEGKEVLGREKQSPLG